MMKNDSNDKLLSEKLKTATLAKGMKQQDVINELKNSVAGEKTIKTWYEKERTNPNWQYLKKIASILDVSIDYLTGRTDNMYAHRKLNDLLPDDKVLKEYVSEHNESYNDANVANTSQELGKRIKKALNKRGKGIKDVLADSAKLDLSRATLNKCYDSDEGNCRLSTIYVLSEYLDVSLDYLATRTDDMESHKDGDLLKLINELLESRNRFGATRVLTHDEIGYINGEFMELEEYQYCLVDKWVEECCSKLQKEEEKGTRYHKRFEGLEEFNFERYETDLNNELSIRIERGVGLEV